MSTSQGKPSELFKTQVSPDGVTVVDFSATWCAPCRAYSPIFAKATQQHRHVTFLNVDVDENPEIAEQFNVMSVPTTVFLREGEFVGGFSGVLSEERIADLISQTEQVDMAAVRKQNRR